MSVHVAEKKGNALMKSTNELIATIENGMDGDWQNGQNLVLVTQDNQNKEIENQAVNVAIDAYCSYIFWIYFHRAWT